MAQPVLNPVDLRLLSPLLPAEREFARCLAEGKPCIVGDGKLPATPIESGNESEGNANVVRGEVVRFFAYGGDSDKRSIRGAVITLRGAWILGALDLLHANIPYALNLNCCRFVGPVVMLHAGCGALYLKGSHLAKGLAADGITTKGGVNLRDGFSAEGEVRLLGANVGGSLFCGGGRFNNPKGNALIADRLTTQGDVNLGDGFSAEGEVRLLGANVGGGLSCGGGRFHNLEGYALNADGITTKRVVNLRDGFSAEGEVRLLGANVGGDLSCAGGSFHNPKGKALIADRVTVKGGVFLSSGFSAEGEVRLPGANVGGGLFCEGGRFHNLEGRALNADGIKTKGGVNLREGFFAEGEVRLPGANVGGNLSCKGGRFYNPKGRALIADGVTVKGGVFLSSGLSAEGKVRLFSAEGEVRLLGANVGGHLSCEGGEFHNPKGKALSADGITTEGHVNLHDNFSAEGEVRLLGANIGGRLSCEGGRFHNLEGCALNVESAIINGGFIWREISGGGRVELGYAKIGVFADDADSCKPFEVVLDGFTYDQIVGPTDAKSRIEWLAKRPGWKSFSPLPYEQAAKVLRSMGKDIDAWDIEREKRRLEREERNSKNALKVPLWRRLWGRGIDALTDFVYRPWKTLGAAVLVVVAGACLFNFANDNGRMVPHQPVVLANAEYREATNSPCAEFKCPPEKRPTELVKRLFPDYPEFNALVYSADVFIPFFALHQEPYWYPKSREMDGWFFRWFMPFWYWLEIGAGWVLTSLFLLSITGLLRPRQSSGEKG